MAIDFQQIRSTDEANSIVEAHAPKGTSRAAVELLMEQSGAQLYPQEGGLICVWEANVSEIVKQKWLLSFAFDRIGRLTAYSINGGLVGP